MIRRVATKVVLPILFAITFLTSAAFAAPASIVAGGGSVQPGQPISIPISFVPGDLPAASIQFDLIYGSNFSYANASTAGAAATAAGKAFSVSTVGNGASAGLRVLVWAPGNTTAIGSGQLGTVVLNALPGVPTGNYPLSITQIYVTSASNQSVATTGTGGAINVGGGQAAAQLRGTVTLNGSPLNGVSIYGGALGTVSTNVNGAYSFTNVSNGTSYNLTPSLAGYQFSPSSAQGVVSGDTIASFTAAASTGTRYNLSGTITGNGAPLAGVNVLLGVGSESRITGTDGKYSFTAVAAGTNYALTPSRAGYVFNPTTRTGVLNADVTSADFSGFTTGATPTPTPTPTATPGGTPTPTPTNPGTGGNTISGRVLFGGRTPLPGVAVKIGGYTAITDANGAYSVSGLGNTRYFLSARLRGFRFNPLAGRRIDLRNGSFTAADFEVSCTVRSKTLVNGTCDYLRYSISGRILLNGAGLAGVRVRASNKTSTTDANGNYSLTGLRAGLRYNLRPRLNGHNFGADAGSSRVVLDKDYPNFNFTAFCRRGYTAQNGQCLRTPRN